MPDRLELLRSVVGCLPRRRLEGLAAENDDPSARRFAHERAPDEGVADGLEAGELWFEDLLGWARPADRDRMAALLMLPAGLSSAEQKERLATWYEVSIGPSAEDDPLVVAFDGIGTEDLRRIAKDVFGAGLWGRKRRWIVKVVSLRQACVLPIGAPA